MTATHSTLTPMPTRPDSGHFNITPARIGIYGLGIIGLVLCFVIKLWFLAPIPLVAGVILGTPRGGVPRVTRIQARIKDRRTRKRYHGEYFSASTATIEYKITDEAIAKQRRQPIPEVAFQAQPYGDTGWAGLLTTPSTGHDTLIVEVRGGRFALADAERQLAINQRIGAAMVEATEGREEEIRLTFISCTGPDIMVDRLINLEGSLPDGFDLQDSSDPLAANLLEAFDTVYKGATRTFTGYALSVARPEKLLRDIRVPTDEFIGLPIFDVSRKFVAGLRAAGYNNTGMVGAMDLAKYVRRGWDFDPTELTRYMRQAAAERFLTDPTLAKTWLGAWPARIDFGYNFCRIGPTFNRVLRVSSLTRRAVHPNHFAPLYHMKGLMYSFAVPIDFVPAEKAAKSMNFEATARRGRLLGNSQGRRERPGDKADLTEVEAREQRLYEERSPEAHYFPLLRLTARSLPELEHTQEAVINALASVSTKLDTIEGESKQLPAILTSMGLPLL